NKPAVDAKAAAIVGRAICDARRTRSISQQSFRLRRGFSSAAARGAERFSPSRKQLRCSHGLAGRLGIARPQAGGYRVHVRVQVNRRTKIELGVCHAERPLIFSERSFRVVATALWAVSWDLPATGRWLQSSRGYRMNWPQAGGYRVPVATG